MIDYHLTPAPGVEAVAYSRLVPNGAGVEYVFTQFQAPGMPDEVFAGQVQGADGGAGDPPGPLPRPERLRCPRRVASRGSAMTDEAIVPEPSLEVLVERAKAGDGAALEAVVRAIQDRVYNLAIRMLWHPADAEDATQEILIRVITNLGSFRGESAFVDLGLPSRR